VKKLALVIVFVTAVGAFPAHAITYGTKDGTSHPYVGMIKFWDASGASWRCSGTALTSTVVLTAAHCTSGATTAKVWFAAEVPDVTVGGLQGTPHTHPSFISLSFTAPDVGVVVLSKAVKLNAYGALPKAGSVPTLAGSSKTSHATVGYGLQDTRTIANEITRYRGTVKIQQTGGSLGDYAQISSNSTPMWSGGTCAGDSGGPLFQQNTNVILAITSGGVNTNCKGASYDYRVDVDSARSFLSNYVTLP
jgi:secreted trypsin-like serine protease